MGNISNGYILSAAPKMSKRKNLLYLLCVPLAVLGILIGLFISDNIRQVVVSDPPPEKPLPYSIKKEEVKYVVVSLDLLQNPMFSNWSGEVGGRVIEKKSDSFTLKHVNQVILKEVMKYEDAKDGETMVIQYDPERTNFQKVTYTSRNVVTGNVLYSDIKVGDVVIGNVIIEKQNGNARIIGRGFIVQNVK